MIECEFCPEQFEYEEDYKAHVRIKHPDEYQRQLLNEQIEAHLGPMFSKIMAATLSSTAAELTKIALEHMWAPKLVINYYREILRLLQEEEETGVKK